MEALHGFRDKGSSKNIARSTMRFWAGWAAAQSDRDAQKEIRSMTFKYGRHAGFEFFVEPLTGTERGRSEYPAEGAFCAQDRSEVSEQPIPL